MGKDCGEGRREKGGRREGGRGGGSGEGGRRKKGGRRGGMAGHTICIFVLCVLRLE